MAGAEGLVSLPTTAYLYGYWQPWALAFAVGYLGTAWFGRADPRVPVVSRLAYVLAGLASVAYLLASLTTPFPGARDVVLVLGALHVGPIAVAVCDTGTR
ncbi:hypothetical protein BRD17_03560 [Halobacteriales archaeon SW_7_68_16]|nr:MAG: hypothetical protein BRD17_03560 [Halobacteriales archaeon SW_7_68_16]